MASTFIIYSAKIACFYEVCIDSCHSFIKAGPLSVHVFDVICRVLIPDGQIFFNNLMETDKAMLKMGKLREMCVMTSDLWVKKKKQYKSTQSWNRYLQRTEVYFNSYNYR